MEERAKKSLDLLDYTVQKVKKEEDSILTHEFDFYNEASDPSQEKMLEIFRYYTLDGDRDLYGNLRCDFLRIKTDKSRNSIDVLKLFKPGEILRSLLIKD